MPPTEAVPNPSTAQPDDAGSQAWNLEALIGSRVLLGAGLLSLLAGIAFFIKLANDHHLIAPELRVLCGLVAGLALMTGGAHVLRRRRTLVAEGLTGLGASALYLSLWGAYGPFQLVDARIAFAAMIAVTVTLALIAWARGSRNVALAGVVGGALTPALLLAGAFDRVTLAAYLAVLFGTMLVLAVRCRFRSVELASFGAALCYAFAFAPSSVGGGEPWSSTQSIIVASIFFAEFAAALFVSARRDKRVDPVRLGTLAAEVLAYATVLELELGANLHTLAIADAGFAAVLLAAVAARVPETLRVTYGILGLGVLTRAVEAWGGGHALTSTLAIEGAALALAGIRSADIRLRGCGYAGLGLAICGALYALHMDSPVNAIFNPRTFTVAVVVSASIAVLRDISALWANVADAERKAVQRIGLMVTVALAIGALSADAITATADAAGWTTATQTTLSILWAVAATALVAGGFRFRSPLARYLGIALFIGTAAKVFTVDLVGLDAVLRVISALVVGAVLVAVAAGYQAVMLRERHAS